MKIRDTDIIKRTIWCLLIALSTSFISLTTVAFAKETPKPKLMLANIYHEGIDLSQYWVSEKYDGVRALWDGKQFISRGGNIYHAPAWFIADFPKTKLDGELWIARQRFELLLSTVRDKIPNDKAWEDVKFMVFDLPDMKKVFDDRLMALKTLIQSLDIPWLKAVEQRKFEGHVALMDYLNLVTAEGAEGLMLHKGSSLYRAKRTGDLLKLKQYQDAEAKVVAHIPGKGKYKNKMGAVLVVLENGIKFKIGSGFSDKDRANPPKVGDTITYQYRGFTKNGVPRFATFLRVRYTAKENQ